MRLSELEALFARYGLREAFYEQEALFRWPQVVGERVARLSEPLAVREGILYVRVTHHVFAQELTLMREQFLDPLNRCLRRPLKDIRFKVAPLHSPPVPQPKCPEIETIELEAAERAHLRALVAEVTSEPVRRALRRWFETRLKVEKSRASGPHIRRCPGCGLYHDGRGELCAWCELERPA